MDRRSFLGSLVGTTAIVGEARAGAPGDDIGELVARIRSHVADVASDADRDLGARANGFGWYADAMGAMGGVDAIAEIPAADQAHPGVQALLSEVLAAVGTGLVAAHALLTEVADEEEPDAERFGEVIRRVRANFGRARTSSRSGQLQQSGLDLLHDAIRADSVRGEARRGARRLARLISLSKRIAEDPWRTGVLSPADPAIQQEVIDGAARHGPVERRPPTPIEVLGLIGCGLGLFVGGYFVLVGIACAVGCGAPAVALLALFGGAVIAASVWGMRRIRQNRVTAYYVDAETPAHPVETADGRATARAAANWTVVLGFRAEPDTEYVVMASGSVVMTPDGPALGPAGDPRLDGTQADLVRFAPVGSLVVRIGSQVFECGAAVTRITSDTGGIVEIAVNGPEGRRDGASGSFDVQIVKVGD